MYRITVLLLFASFFSYAQIDYKSLIKNLEEITIETNLNEYFDELPSENRYDDLVLNDERFLRFYSIIVDKVSFSSGWRGRTMTLKFFDESRDYESIKKILSEKYGEPEIDQRDNSINYEWKVDEKELSLNVNTEDGVFKSFDSLDVIFNTK
ncbi:hypothetical protein [uncultured Aquimarina sp.]|uniref:hypothetical protein n=1 Tax=uncultured Aquimarina sp. TaxID=575652 RepID=UPI00262D9E81|nr:hypothetical protein [uncultured Aquimarina sp.]